MAKYELKLKMDDYPDMPLRDVVFHTLRNAILHGDLKPGERLMEIRLANVLGVSRTPIREAIRMLELEGLVIMVPRKGAHVARITEKDMNEVLEVRMGLEEFAARLACERITEEQGVALKAAAMAFEMEIEKDTDDISGLAEADVKFHDIIYQATGNKRLMQLINNLREQMYRYRVEYLKDKGVRKQLAEEHAAILKALMERDYKRAFFHTFEHISKQQVTIKQMVKDQLLQEEQKEVKRGMSPNKEGMGGRD